MSKSDKVNLDHLNKIDERIKKEYPNKKSVPLGKIISAIGKKKPKTSKKLPH